MPSSYIDFSEVYIENACEPLGRLRIVAGETRNSRLRGLAGSFLTLFYIKIRESYIEMPS
jgi:hypothetical protein